MEKKNPLENIRKAIIGGQFSGIENEVTRLGVSDELMKISDALDSFYGIVREKKEEPLKKSGLIGVMDEVYKSNSYLSSLSQTPYSRYQEESFSDILSLLRKVKDPLSEIKRKLPNDNPLYMNISTIISSIAVNSVVSRINSYQPSGDYRGDLFTSITGVDYGYSQLISNGSSVFKALEGFDMMPDCLDNYKANKKVIYSQNKEIQDRVLNHETRMSRKSSSGSGCLVMALVLSTSMLSCLGLIVTLFL